MVPEQTGMPFTTAACVAGGDNLLPGVSLGMTHVLVSKNILGFYEERKK